MGTTVTVDSSTFGGLCERIGPAGKSFECSSVRFPLQALGERWDKVIVLQVTSLTLLSQGQGNPERRPSSVETMIFSEIDTESQ